MLVGKVKEDRVQTIIDKLTVMTSGKDDVRDIASLGKPTSPDLCLVDEADALIASCALIMVSSTQDGRTRDLSRLEACKYSMYKASA